MRERERAICYTSSKIKGIKMPYKIFFLGLMLVLLTACGGGGSTNTTVTEAPDTQAPIITLIGDATVTLTVGGIYTEQGASAVDDVDGNLTDDINTTGEVDTDLAATYTVKYNVKDSAGNVAAEVARTVIVKPQTTQLKKTGQTTSYNTSGTEVTDGSIKDDGFYQKGTTPSYTRDDTTDIVTDHITGLEWQDDTEAKSILKNWADAKAYCAAKGGGWRLPSRKELVGLSDYGRNGPAIDPTFSNVASSNFWSSTTFAGYSDRAWSVYFRYGGQYYDGKARSGYVRCVRAGQ